MAVFGGGVAASNVPIDQSTPWIAAADGNLPLLQTALPQLNLSPSAADENGYTLIHAAASYAHLPVLQWLVSQGANVHAVDGEGDSALHYASNRAAAEFLVREGKVSLDVRNQAGMTALQAKEEELKELMEDEDFDEMDEDAINLNGVIEFLKCVAMEQ